MSIPVPRAVLLLVCPSGLAPTVPRPARGTSSGPFASSWSPHESLYHEEPLFWGQRQALAPGSQLFANAESPSLCPSVHPSVHLGCGGGAWPLLQEREVCAEILGWRKRWGGVCLGDWRSREQRALTPGPGAEKSGLPRGKGCDNSHRLSPCHICFPGLPSVSTHLVFVFTLWVSTPASSPGGGCGKRVSVVFVCSLPSLGPGAPGAALWDTPGWPPGPSPAPAHCDPLPHELCSH